MLKVLLVDDDPSLLAALRRSLMGQQSTFEILMAKEGQEALEVLAVDGNVDLVISDMRMPKMDGADFLELVREKHPQTVRIIMSGYSEFQSAANALQSAHQFIAKPANSQKLISVIDQARTFCDGVPADFRTHLAENMTLPSPPSVVKTFNAAVQSSATAETLIEIVRSDAALTAKILQIANSSYFRDPIDTTNVTTAIHMLGADTFHRIAQTTELCRPFVALNGASIDAFSANANTVASLAESLADADKKDDARTAGLLHDVGLLALAEEFPSPQDAPAALQTEIGAMLLGIWGLPASIITAIDEQRRTAIPEGKSINAVHAVRLAVAAESRRTPGWSDVLDLTPGYAESFGLDMQTL